MLKKLLQIFLLSTSILVTAQECPDLLNPVDGETNVPVDTSIMWAAVDGIPGYQIRLGTVAGGSDLGQATVGSATSYTPPLGLPENTEVFVTIVLDFLFEGGEDIICESQSFITEDVTTAPGCSQLQIPADGAENVSVFTTLSWLYAPTATEYDITIGTAPGLGDLFTDTLTNLSFIPPAEFPPDTTIFVDIIPRNENGGALNCQTFSFTTGEVAPLPGCTTLTNPLNGAINVPLTPLLEWIPIPGATGYRVTIGTTPGAADVLDEAVFFTNSTFVIDFDPNRNFFITIVPFNDSGDALGCGEETFSTLLGCGPFLDPESGEFVSLAPEIEFPEVFSFCENGDPLTLTAPEGADGYRWFQIDQFGNEIRLSEDDTITITENGQYYLESYLLVTQPGDNIECPTISNFEVVSSSLATIDNIAISETASGLDITIEASGIGDYEFALNDSNGPYQDSNFFGSIPPGVTTVYVRDKNGCGIVEERIELDLTVEGFPKFFSPNDDGTNDFWQYIPPLEGEPLRLDRIFIYDRYGKLLKQLAPDSLGWDGTYNGSHMPIADYWFVAYDQQNQRVSGHFSIIR